MPLTTDIARFLCSDFQPSPQAFEIARRGTIDALAVMLAGRQEHTVLTVQEYVRSHQGGQRSCSALLEPRVCGVRHAALLNGVAAHVLDYDDVAPIGHPSAVLVPALLAAGETMEADGRAFLEAYIAGYEAWAELLTRERGVHHDKGWHPTAVFGTVGAAAAVARLRKLPLHLVSSSLGIAASLASGLVANFGSMTKAYHIGHAAASGIEAVELAICGMTASNDALESDQGFLRSFSPDGDVDRDTPAFSHETLHIERLGISIKHYPVCYAAHRVIDAARSIASGFDLSVDDIKHVEVKIGASQAGMLKYRHPKNSTEAKFSLEFAVACALYKRNVVLEDMKEPCLTHPEIQRLIDATTVLHDNSRSAYSNIFSEADSVLIHHVDGRRIGSNDIPYPRGSFKLPVRNEDLEQKFLDCAGPEAAGFYEYLVEFDKIASVSGIAEHYQGMRR